MEILKLDGIMFSKMIEQGAINLKNNASIVNDLNVFPIPDGDTGDNMFSTINGGVSATLQNEADLQKSAKTISDGMLLGARGNSGVILSQFFAGIADGFASGTANVQEFAKACQNGVQRAYKSVNVPTEGTILTVAREATEYAISNTDEKSDFCKFVAAFKEGAEKSLDNTPELLAVLKEAGVVDSGGAGLIYIIEGMMAALCGNEISDLKNSISTPAKQIDISGFDENSVLEFGYCTEVLLRLQNAKTDIASFNLDELKAFLETIGNSIVAIQNGSVVKIHVHTMTPGDVLAHCQKYGEFLTLKIENMSLQHSESVVENRYTKKEVKKDHVHCAIVSTATGEGIKETFSAYGTDVIVDGGQSMNPSSEDFIEAFERVNADIIVVLPNNSNVIMSAEQAASLYKKAEVIVLDTKTLGEGLVALTMMDKFSKDIPSMLESVKEAYRNVITGMVSKTVRDAKMGDVEIKNGDYIGFVGKTIFSSKNDKIEVSKALIDNISLDERDILIIIKGRETNAEENQAIVNYASEKYSGKEIYEIDGGQDIYDFIFVSE